MAQPTVYDCLSDVCERDHLDLTIRPQSPSDDNQWRTFQSPFSILCVVLGSDLSVLRPLSPASLNLALSVFIPSPETSHWIHWLFEIFFAISPLGVTNTPMTRKFRSILRDHRAILMFVAHVLRRPEFFEHVNQPFSWDPQHILLALLPEFSTNIPCSLSILVGLGEDIPVHLGPWGSWVDCGNRHSAIWWRPYPQPSARNSNVDLLNDRIEFSDMVPTSLVHRFCSVHKLHCLSKNQIYASVQPVYVWIVILVLFWKIELVAIEERGRRGDQGPPIRGLGFGLGANHMGVGACARVRPSQGSGVHNLPQPSTTLLRTPLQFYNTTSDDVDYDPFLPFLGHSLDGTNFVLIPVEVVPVTPPGDLIALGVGFGGWDILTSGSEMLYRRH
ncbi:hypothetical protein FA15DRAFT_661318 [Coprinopsis marcescibilis]|uniref:Uncharacterized protein n=1 Tax=Coprinopsis marcescibilis TaxID=230819 RepID=A0A5C3KC81_COPMA|nr:hypothetical protein FA15DRAFT_661318 [Coprinopsis marcescibilis]